ncbi:MAG: thioesterase family protein [Planctomycetota bacterium]|nr:thioesterase family protein [Planctomycetota bacterium]
MTMAHAFSHTIQIEFGHTDMAGIVHFANFFQFMEATEHAFFRSFGQNVHVQDGARVSGWVRAHAECDYRIPVRYPDEVTIHLRVLRKGNKSLSYGFTFECSGDKGAQVVATGKLVVVHLTGMHGGEAPHTAPIPTAVSELIEEAPDQVTP